MASESQARSSELALHQFFQRPVFQFYALHCARTLLGSHVVRHCPSISKNPTNVGEASYFPADRSVFTRPLMFSRTVASFFLASSVSNAVCATASRIGLNSSASLMRRASLLVLSPASTRWAKKSIDK